MRAPRPTTRTDPSAGLLTVAAATLFGSVVLVLAIAAAGRSEGADYLARFYFYSQDLVLLLAMAAACIVLRVLPASPAGTARAAPRRAPLAIVIGLAGVAAWIGHHLVMAGYDKSRDEQMANFDAAIFMSGQLVAPIAEQWRPMLGALNSNFMLPIGQNEAWVSGYLPVNAAFRALFGLVGDQDLTGPFFLMVGAAALVGIIRRLWPERGDLGLAGLLLYVGSGQIMASAMTSYAMTGHLALNLVWLWLFLADRRATDTAALGIGFLAVGLHQPIFHPLFAAPILCVLLWRRDWRRAVFYAVGYAVICAFWLWWPLFMNALAAVQPAHQAVPVDHYARLAAVMATAQVDGAMTMIFNLLRFAAWQHLLLLPLAAMGAALAMRQRDPLFIALTISLLLPVAVTAIILPVQGLGWGYRYLHPVLGNAILLAMLGWSALSLEAGTGRLMRNASVAALLVLLPIQLMLAHRLYAPHAALDRAIASSGADLAFIDSSSTPVGGDMVLNRPGLDNRPVRLDPLLVSPEQFVRLCAGRPTVAVYGDADFAEIRAVLGRNDRSRKAAAAQRIDLAARAGCRIVRRPAA